MDKPTLKPRGSGKLHARLSKNQKAAKPGLLEVLKAMVTKKTERPDNLDEQIAYSEPEDKNEYVEQSFSNNEIEEKPIIEKNSENKTFRSNTIDSRKEKDAIKTKVKQEAEQRRKLEKTNRLKEFKMNFLTKRVKKKTNTMNVLGGGHNPAYLILKDILDVLGPSKTIKPKKPSLILANIEGKEVYWNLTEKGAKLVSDLEKGHTALSFTSDDYRVSTTRGISGVKASEELSKETGLKNCVVNKSSELHAVYGTPKERSEGLRESIRLVPGALVLDRLVKRKAEYIDLESGDSLIFGIDFPKIESPSESAAVVLSCRGPGGEISTPQVSINPESVDFLISQFTAARKIPRAKAKVIMFSFTDYLEIEEELANLVYPAEPSAFGFPIKNAMAIGLVGSTILAGYTGANLTLSSLMKKEAENRYLSSTNLAITYKETTKNLASSRPRELAQIFGESLSPDMILEFSQKVYIPSAKLSAEAKDNVISFRMKVPILDDTYKVVSNEAISAKKMKEILSYEPPEQCIRNKVVFTENLNEIIVEVTCTGVDSPIHQLRSR